ncbi:putative DIP5-glutamate and aspartate permease [Emericellopsis cladophorae]|uniref:DIP5-glutamate and aspartate permease n=1 Tax=Emericellopsis cladophorae TaxID=2686198 RepID=A0A9P9Y032_9HYPO|nr:putative DIP5-glutamate and aspartate permease [Emericellopsis cladophorae]KAI6780494.1 putative DIP5-glutamate and aspartate permease [Emericellopsis cladophorae]
MGRSSSWSIRTPGGSGSGHDRHWRRAGTGLIIGTGAALAKAGPGSLFISYTFIGAIVFLLIAALGEIEIFLVAGDEPFDWRTLITGYLGIPLYLLLLFGHMLVKKSLAIAPRDVDFYTGKDIIDREEEAFLAKKEKMAASRAGWNRFYDGFLPPLFLRLLSRPVTPESDHVRGASARA